MNMYSEVDILYVHPTKAIENTLYTIMPVGVIGLANMLIKAGYTLKGINLGVEKSIKRNYSIEDDLKAIKYKVLLMDLHWYEHSFGVMQIARISKEINTHIPVVIGGMSATIFADQILKDFSCIDYIVKGDSEQPLLMLMDSLLKDGCNKKDIPNIAFREKASIVNKEISYCCQNFDEIDFTSLGFLRNNIFYYNASTSGLDRVEEKNFWLCIARGCIFNCSYCCGSHCNSKMLFGRDTLLVRSKTKIVEDIKVIYEKGVKKINPTHDFEIFGRQYYTELFALLREDNIKPGLYLECFQLPSFHFLEEIMSTFDIKATTIAISPLTADQKIRNENGKKFSNEEMFKLLDYLVKNNITTQLYYSMNVPGENENTFQDTLNQIQYIIENYPLRLLKFCCQGVVVDPMAPVRKKNQDIKIELETFMDYYNYCKNNLKFYVGYQDSFTKELRNRQYQYDNLLENVIKKLEQTT
jgi:radical SAM superfamily enzyme YgiQ (UPF0313 family)